MIYGQILIEGWENIYDIPEKSFFVLSVMTAEDLLQLPTVREKLIFSHFCIRMV